MLDVPADEVARIDRAGMMQAVLSLPDQVEDALAKGPFPRTPTPTRVLIAGMGGSAIGGGYVAAWADRAATVPVVVSRTYSIPNWVDADTLVLAVSYSGETEETLAAFAEARQRGARLAAVSTGGRLERYAKAAGAPFYQVPAGGQPRAAIGSMLSTEALALEAAGVLDARPGLEAAVKTLRAMVADVAPDVAPPRNEAKRLALAINGTIPAFYGADALAPVATRAANQVQENAKSLAWSAVMPEMNHNELVGWSGTADVDGVSAVFLRDRQEPRAIAERWEFTGDLARHRGARLVQLEARGEHLLARQLSLTFVADAASVYLAVLRGLDPTPVDVIADLKKRVASAGVVAETDKQF